MSEDGDLGRRDRQDRSTGPASEGVEHLQTAAREMIAAARSFLDAAEHVVEDRRAVEEISSTVSGLVAGLGDALGRRDAPWAAAAWGRDGRGTSPDASDAVDAFSAEDEGSGDEVVLDVTEDSYTDRTEDWARGLVDPVAPRRPSRVRRISVE